MAALLAMKECCKSHFLVENKDERPKRNNTWISNEMDANKKAEGAWMMELDTWMDGPMEEKKT